MRIHLGYIQQLVRYPVKSMAGIATDTAILGWHGLQGDRRYAFRRMEDKSHFPWLSASKLPELLLYQPLDEIDQAGEPIPGNVRNPEGNIFPLWSEALRKDVEKRYGHPLELMNLKHGIFDESPVSLIDMATMSAISHDANEHLDTRRFRANIVMTSDQATPFVEDEWVGGEIMIGDDDQGPVLHVTMRDVRCMMINLHPDTAKQHPQIMKTTVRMNDNCAGVYANVVRPGQMNIGQPIYLTRTV